MEINFKDILIRILKVFKLKNNKEFALKFGLSYSSVTNWVNRNTIPVQELAQIALENNLSLNWLLLGLGPIYNDNKVVDNIFNEHVLVSNQSTLIDNSKNKNNLINAENKNAVIDPMTFDIFKNIYTNYANKNKLKELRLYLIELDDETK